jgi:arylformamidase
MVTLKGYPAPLICDYLSREASRAVYAEGTEFHIGRIDMIANTGTYVDSPFHRYADGKDLSELPLESLADLDAVVVRATERDGRAIGADAFAGVEVRGRAVLVHTGHAAKWGTRRTSKAIPTSRARPPSTCATRAPSSSASTRSTSTTPTTPRARAQHAPPRRHPHLRAHARAGAAERASASSPCPVKVKAFGTARIRHRFFAHLCR